MGIKTTYHIGLFMELSKKMCVKLLALGLGKMVIPSSCGPESPHNKMN